MTAPAAGELWFEAGQDPERYRALMRVHGLVLSPGDPGYDQASRTLPCGWPGPQKPASEWCVHDMPPGTCSFCTGRGQEPEPERGEAGPAFTARFPGKCSGCGDPISEGDRIRADGTGHGYLCQECASEVSPDG